MSHRSSPSFLVLAVLCLVLPLLFSGCIFFKQPIGGGYSGADAPAPVQYSPLDEAKNAYVQGDYAKAETVAMRVASEGSASDRVEANRVLAAAALKNKHPSVALTALDNWRKEQNGADNSREWQDAWAKALRALSSHDARTRANEVYQDATRSGLIRSIAGVVLAVRQWQDGELGQSMEALENIYASAGGSQDKVLIEGRLARELHMASPAASKLAASAVKDDNKTRFPYTIILIDKLRRAGGGASQAALNELAGQATLADTSLFGAVPPESDIEIRPGTSAPAASPGGPVAGQPVVLALPMSGQYGSISAKIVDGAQAACDEMSASGWQTSLIVLDTEKADWITQAKALPKDAAVIGGPMRRDDYAKAKAQGLTSSKAVFAFLPSLETGDEGRSAWRFFTSAQDQVDTLLGFTSRLGIRGYGIFYPEENFGRRMATLFEERARGTGASTVVTQGYAPGNQNDWMSSANSLLSANKSGSVFQAIFLPDSWKNMDVIVPNFFYQNETRQVLLGTSLWEQGLSAGSFVSSQYYGLAVFPGNWNAAQPTPAGQRLQSALAAKGKSAADFWSGLGYDFARFSAKLGVRGDFNPQNVNAALQSASLDWSIAPIRWSAGMASQQMHLFTPSGSGFAPVNEQQFRSAFEEAWR